ncbi:MAG: sulfatase-like hydrolase/transferase, partial [Labilithrix sp.]|nr:sulfatase-like hydrolase/transferase [Labilithrix sp.]
SNVSFRFGVGREGYLDQLYSNPSMWAYAKKAGYDTYYLDAQRFDGRLQSGMDAKELELVDRHIQLGAGVLPEERDVRLAELVREVLRDQAGKPSFMYVQKMGSHFPYEGKYPADQAVAQPTMERTYFGTEADPRPSRMKQASEDKAPDIRLRFKNSYDNSLRWNTKRFFEIVLDGLDMSETVIVFMADHGQDLHQDGRAGFNTHCSTGSDAHPDEGRTFLVLFTHDQEKLAAFREAAAAHYDKTSQFSVFPSMLEWMGYPREQIAANEHFDPPLDAPPAPDNQRFISKYFVRLGAKTIWSSCALPASAKVSSGPAP